MMGGWKQVRAAVQQSCGKKPLAAAVLGLLVAPLGCELTHGLLSTPVGTEARAGKEGGPAEPGVASAAPGKDSAPASLPRTADEPAALAVLSSTSEEELQLHPIAATVKHLLDRLTGEPQPHVQAQDREALYALGGSPETGEGASSPARKLAAAAGKEIVPVSYAIGPQTGGAVLPADLSGDPSDGTLRVGPQGIGFDPAQRPSGPGDLQELPEPRRAGNEKKDRDEDTSFRPNPGIPVIPKPADVQMIDLSEAFNVADNQNQTIGLARARIGEQWALLRAAQSLLLPTLNAGASYHYHNGHFQASTGEIKSRKLQGWYFGGGTRALAAESVGIPMIWVNTRIVEAIYEPQVARARLDSTRFALTATYNRTLMRVADQYLRLVSAETRLLAILQTEIDLQEVTRRTHEYWKTGMGTESDERRAEAEANVLRVNEQRLQEDVAVHSARLSRLLHLDPSVRLTTGGGPLRLICLDLPNGNLEELIQIALKGRPEVKQRSATIASFQAAYRRERMRPWLPWLIFGYSAGAYGGGGSYYSVAKIAGNTGPRTDLDALLVWNWQNLGLGNLALQKEQRAGIHTAEAQLAITVNRVRREVTESYAELQASQRELDLARQRLLAAHSGYEHDLALIKNQVNIRPIELLNSVTRLYRARQEFITTLVNYNMAQIDLFVRLGQAPTMATPESKPVLMPDATGVQKAKEEERQQVRPQPRP